MLLHKQRSIDSNEHTGPRILESRRFCKQTHQINNIHNVQVNTLIIKKKRKEIWFVKWMYVKYDVSYRNHFLCSWKRWRLKREMSTIFTLNIECDMAIKCAIFILRNFLNAGYIYKNCFFVFLSIHVDSFSID